MISKYAKPRQSEIVFLNEEETVEIEEVPDYPVVLFLTRDSYFKKITPQSLRMSGAQKLKENDEIVQEIEATNRANLLFFTDKAQVYKARQPAT